MKNLFSLIGVSLLLLSACNANTPSQEPPDAEDTPAPEIEEEATPLPDISPTTAPKDQFTGDGPWILEFNSADEVSLHGTVYGQGETVGLILIPMHPGEQAGWQDFAMASAETGYRVLTFDFRGYGQSEGEQDLSLGYLDVLGAIDFMNTLELQTIILIGAGQGGLSAIQAIHAGADVDGLVVLSSAQSYDTITVGDEELSTLAIPSLWIGARHDVLQDVETLYELAGGDDKSLVVYESIGVPGTYMLETNEGPNVIQEILAFIERITSPQS